MSSPSDGKPSSAWNSRASTIAVLPPAPSPQHPTQGSPDTDVTEPLPQKETLDVISECFQEATRRWDEDVATKKNSSWAGPPLLLRADIGYPAITPTDLIVAAGQTRQRYLDKSEKGTRGKMGLLYKSVLSNLDRHAKAIDVFIQRDPFVSALVWGSVRVYLQIAVDNSQASEFVAEGILLITTHVERWYTTAELFGTETSIKKALINLYFHMIVFLMPAIQRFRKGSWTRFGSSLLHSESDRAKSRLMKMKEAEKELERELNLANIKHQKAIFQETLRTTADNLAATRGLASRLGTRVSSCPGRIEGTCENIDDITVWVQQLRSTKCRSRITNDFSLSSQTVNDPWILKDARFVNWTNLTSPELLWIVGDTGSGKSDIAKRVFGAYKTLHPGHKTLFHAFYANMSAEERSPITLAASLIDQQLLQCGCGSDAQKSAFQALRTMAAQYRVCPRDCSFDQLWDVCLGLLQDEGKFTVIIDAMDECSFSSRNEALEVLQKLKDASSIPHSQVIMLSRPTLALGIDPSSKVDCSHLRITPRDTAEELNALCDRLSRQLELEEDLQQLAADRAKANAHGSFLWVTLYFQDLNSSHFTKDIRKRLQEDSLPQTCKEFYQRAWKRQNQKLRLNDRHVCREIYSLLLAARQQLTLQEISEAIGLRFGRLQHIISQWCQPFISILEDLPYLTHASVRDFLLDQDDNKSSPRMNTGESDALLARRCLEFLLKDMYGNPDAIGKRLRSNLGLDTSAGEPDRSSFYDHAAQYWDTYLTALDSPEGDLLDLAARFMHRPQFAFWAEYSYRDAGDFQAIRATYIRMGAWARKLSAGERDRLDLDSYYSKAYEDLHRTYKSRGDDVTIPWLPLMQLGMFYFDTGRIDEMDDIRSSVSKGLCEALGKRHPLTLRARSDAAYAPMMKGDVRSAHQMYLEVAKDQREVIPQGESSALYFTLIFQGQAELLLNEFDEALNTLSSASAGFLEIGGTDTNGYLVAQLWYAIIIGFSGNIQQAIKTMELVREKREKLYGPDDGFATTTRIFVGDLYRIEGREEEAIENIRVGLNLRRRLWQTSNPVVIDPSIRLVIALRDFDLEVEAFDIIDDLEDNGDLGKADRFYELCQVTHLKALLLFDGGDTDKSIEILQTILIEAGEEKNNRPLLWVRLDLADILRYRGREGDKKVAHSLFDGLLIKKTTNRPRQGSRVEKDEPDPPRRLEIAEMALRIFRQEGLEKAEILLRKENLEWASRKPLWLPLGMPAADTTRMKPPQGIGKKRR